MVSGREARRRLGLNWAGEICGAALFRFQSELDEVEMDAGTKAVESGEARVKPREEFYALRQQKPPLRKLTELDALRGLVAALTDESRVSRLRKRLAQLEAEDQATWKKHSGAVPG